MTFADSSFDFTTLHTFALADTVAHLTNIGVNPVATTTAFDQTILSQVRADLLARGYTEIAEPSTTRPDFVVLTGVSASDNYNAFITSNWFTYWGMSPVWTWLPGGVDPSWTIIYPWFNPGSVVTFQRATLIVTIVPTTAVSESADRREGDPAVWAGVATSLLGAGEHHADERAERDQHHVPAVAVPDQLGAVIQFETRPKLGETRWP